MAVRNGKCHFVSEQQLISSITRNRYCFNYYKEKLHVDASNINSDGMLKNVHRLLLCKLRAFCGQIACGTVFTSEVLVGFGV